MGVSVDSCKGGWVSLVAFSHDRGYENREEMMKDKSRKKAS